MGQDLTTALTIAPAGERHVIKERLLAASAGLEKAASVKQDGSGTVSRDAGRGPAPGLPLKDGEAEVFLLPLLLQYS